MMPSGGPTEVLRFQLPGHGAATLRNMNQLRSDQRFCDITIVANDNLKFRGHRVIFAACSPFLRDQFLLNPSSELQVSLLHSSKIVADLLLSCYTGFLEFAVRDIVNYLTAASYLQMEHVVEKCRNALTQFIEPKIGIKEEGSGASCSIGIAASCSRAKGNAAGTSSHRSRKGVGLCKPLMHSGKPSSQMPTQPNLQLPHLHHAHQQSRFQQTAVATEDDEDIKVKIKEFAEECGEDYDEDYEDLSDICIVEDDGGSVAGGPEADGEQEGEGDREEGDGDGEVEMEGGILEDDAGSTTTEAQTTSTKAKTKIHNQKASPWQYRRPYSLQQSILGSREEKSNQEGDNVHSTGEGLGGEELEASNDHLNVLSHLPDEGLDECGDQKDRPQHQQGYISKGVYHQQGVVKAHYSLSEDSEGLLVIPRQFSRDDEDDFDENTCSNLGLDRGSTDTVQVGSTSSYEEIRHSFSTSKDLFSAASLSRLTCGSGMQLALAASSLGLKTIKCNKCEEFFQSVEKLVTHMRSIHYIFMCPRCGKQFNHSSNLNRHMNVHRGVKSHSCHICGKSFTQKSTLYDHMNLHSGERPYRCSYCDVRFAHKPAIRRHLKEQHGKTTAENCMDANNVAEISVVVR
ncbi:zinc finger and BTB domain-containing protein 12.2 [Polypterus senegalus]|nr:zinc finger and BTB domain-containing protein 12.2 [Polypterus senegalus]